VLECWRRRRRRRRRRHQELEENYRLVVIYVL
jgi:hypothetical protein